MNIKDSEAERFMTEQNTSKLPFCNKRFQPYYSSGWNFDSSFSKFWF